METASDRQGTAASGEGRENSDSCYERPHKVDDDESREMKKEPTDRRLTDRRRGRLSWVVDADNCGPTVVKGKSKQQLFQCERPGMGMGWEWAVVAQVELPC